MNANHQTNFKSSSARRHDGDRAFTLTELLVVLATLGMLTVILLPALASNRPGSTRAIQCVNSMRQLGLASGLYANDNHDRLASNNDQFPAVGANKSANWICPYGVTLDWSANARNTNTIYLTANSPIYGTALFANYVASAGNIYVCPADKYLSANQKVFAAGGLSSRMRSCAMDGAMGDGSKWFSAADGGGGGWPAYYEAKKLSDLHSPGPSACWLIIDEHPDSDDDAVLFVNPADASSATSDDYFTGLPGSMHNNGAGLVYADGHSEVHVWQGRITTEPVKYVTYLQSLSVGGDPASQNDMTWLAQHTPAN